MKCTDNSLINILAVVKRMMTIIQIAVPVLLIVFSVYHLFLGVKNPDDKKNSKKVITSFIAAAIIFLFQ